MERGGGDDVRGWRWSRTGLSKKWQIVSVVPGSSTRTVFPATASDAGHPARFRLKGSFLRWCTVVYGGTVLYGRDD